MVAAAVPCPTNPPPPPGTMIWTAPVSHNLEAWAVSILNNPTAFPMLSTAYAVVDGQPVVARVEHHTWVGKTGQTGVCIRGITLYHPTVLPFVPAQVPPSVATRALARGIAAGPQAAAPLGVTSAQAQGSAQGARLLEVVSFGIVAFTSAYGIATAVMQKRHPPRRPAHNPMEW